ncbi:MAG: BON domain-containing protein [Candidatus Binatia bacterium]
MTTTIKGKLAAEKGSTLTRVRVDTNRGVQLFSVVDSTAHRSLAERVTRGVSGVKGVTNNLQAK